MIQGWTPDINANAAVANTGFAVRQRFLVQSPDPKGSFQCAIPMRHVFGFMDDYTKVTYGMRDTLLLIRKDCSALLLPVLEKWYCLNSHG